MNPVERTHGHLSTQAYTSPEWYEREQQELFGRVWQFGGFVEDVAGAGDYVTVQAGCHPLLVVRGSDGELRAFHNICRHRGTQLLRTIGKSKTSLICPYHHWTYSLDGALKSIPGKKDEFPDVDMSSLCLHRASVATWQGMFFVHPDPDAEPLSDWFAGVEGQIGPHRPEELVEYEEGRDQTEIAANWKIVVENYIDGYHLAHLHSDTLSMYDHGRQQSGFAGPHYLFYEPLSSDYLASVERQSPLPLIDHGTREELGAYAPLLFPNLGLAATEGSWSTFHIIPLAADRTLVDTRTRVMPVSDWTFMKQGMSAWWNWKGKTRSKFDGGHDDPLSSGDFMAEDVYACEQQFKAMKSPHFAVGAMARTQERSLLEFQQHVLSYFA